MFARPDPSPRAAVGKRDQPPSPAFSPAGLASGPFGFTKGVTLNGMMPKRQNVQQSPLSRQQPHHEVLAQQVALQMKSKPLTPTMKIPSQPRFTSASSKNGLENINQQQFDLGLSNGPPPPPPLLQGAIKAIKPVAKKTKAVSKAGGSVGGAEEEDQSGGGRWTQEEDRKLREGVTAIGATKWKKISEEYLDGKRSDVQCLHRWQKVLRPGLVKGPWTEEEDNMIRACIDRKITKWSEIAERIPGRIGKQCRERWFNHLDPTIDHSPWTEEEEKVLVTAQAKFGNRWCEIAKLLPGRPENAVKNRWNSAIRRKWQIKLGLTVTDNKGKPIAPQPPKAVVTLPLPELVPVVKKKLPIEATANHNGNNHNHNGHKHSDSQVGSESNNTSIPGSEDLTQALIDVMGPTGGASTSTSKKARGGAKTTKKRASKKETAAAAAAAAGAGVSSSSATPGSGTKKTTKRASRKKTTAKNAPPPPGPSMGMPPPLTLSANLLHGAAVANGMMGGTSPVGQLQWDFDFNNGDFGNLGGLDQLDMFNLHSTKNGPSSHLFLQQQLAKNMASPIGPVGAWESFQPAELDKGMAGLTLSMLDGDFDALGPHATGLKTDDSLGMTWNNSALSPNFAESPKN